MGDDYTYSYAGNRLTRLNNGTVSTSPFTYDSNGNMISDVRRGISSISYNELNLPEEINNGRMSYVYLSDGTKLAALKDGVGYVYVGSMVFSCDFSATTPQLDFESTGFSAGRFVKNDSSVESEYHVNDYLCSVRVVTDAEGEVLERNDYSGFGKRLASSSGTQNRYRFIGKEDQSTLGLPWQDFGARMYDPDLARWTSPDPLSEHYPGISPYAYCNGDPVNLVDRDGRIPDVIWDVASIGMGIRNLVDNIKAGNVKEAIGDGAGIVVDALAAMTPFVPGGVGVARAGVKAADVLDDGGKSVEITKDVFKHRVKLRNNTKEVIRNNAPKDMQGRFIDPNGLTCKLPCQCLGFKSSVEFNDALKHNICDESGMLSVPKAKYVRFAVAMYKIKTTYRDDWIRFDRIFTDSRGAVIPFQSFLQSCRDQGLDSIEEKVKEEFSEMMTV